MNIFLLLVSLSVHVYRKFAVALILADTPLISHSMLHKEIQIEKRVSKYEVKSSVAQ